MHIINWSYGVPLFNVSSMYIRIILSCKYVCMLQKGSVYIRFDSIGGNTSQNTENNNSEVLTTYGCLHQWIIDTYRHACKNTVEQSDDDVVTWGIRVQEVRKRVKQRNRREVKTEKRGRGVRGKREHSGKTGGNTSCNITNNSKNGNNSSIIIVIVNASCYQLMSG